jgi:sugar phosphate isomerase/epimerase
MAIAFLMPEERTSIAAYKKIAADLNKAGAICKKAGIQLCYHNHDFEFQELEGQIPFDILANETDPGLVKFELDLFWVSKAGKDPIDLFKQYKGRVALWHVKDMDNTPNKNFTEVGSGVIDYARIFKHAKTAGMKHFFVEQDVCPGAPLNSIRKSITYVQSTLLKNL